MHPARAYKGMGMEGPIARWYTRITFKDFHEFHALAERISTLVPPGGSILEIAPGPGYLAVELARPRSYTVTGLDISRTFVDIARARAEAEGVTAAFVQGDAAHMPFPGGSFDFIVCRAAFKNFTDPVGAIGEMHRVLVKGGRALIIDLRRDVSRREIYAYVDSLGLTVPNSLMTKLTFRYFLLKRAYLASEIADFAKETPFQSNCDIRESPIGMEIQLVS